MSEQWEYEVIKLEEEAKKRVEDLPKDVDLLDFIESPKAARDLARQVLNDLGAEGWELVVMEYDSLIFKRPKAGGAA